MRVKSGSSYREQPVTVGATSALDVVVTSGVNEGTVVARNVASPPPSSDSSQDGTSSGPQQ